MNRSVDDHCIERRQDQRNDSLCYELPEEITAAIVHFLINTIFIDSKNKKNTFRTVFPIRTVNKIFNKIFDSIMARNQNYLNLMLSPDKIFAHVDDEKQNFKKMFDQSSMFFQLCLLNAHYTFLLYGTERHKLGGLLCGIERSKSTVRWLPQGKTQAITHYCFPGVVELTNQYTFTHSELPIKFHFIKINHEKLDDSSKKLLPDFCMTWDLEEGRAIEWDFQKNVDEFSDYIKSTIQCDHNATFTIFHKNIMPQFSYPPFVMKPVSFEQKFILVDIMQFINHLHNNYHLVINKNEARDILIDYHRNNGVLKNEIIEALTAEKQHDKVNILNNVEKILLDSLKPISCQHCLK